MPETEGSSRRGGSAVVTGVTSGFGTAIARAFHARGRRVVGLGRRGERLAALRSEMGSSFHPVAVDIRDRGALIGALQDLPDGFGDIDVLVNNAGVALGLELAQDSSLDDWDQMIDTNCKALAFATRAVLPGMVARNAGHVVNIGSQAGEWPYPGANVYGATKAFVRQFSLNLRADLWGTRVRVTNIEPGMAGGTEFSDVRFSGDSARAKALYEGVEALTPEDIADAVIWVTDRPPHVNVNSMQVMPVAKSFSRLRVWKPEPAAPDTTGRGSR